MTSNDDRGLGAPSRRRLLAATGAAGAGLLAGCLGGGAAGGGDDQGGTTTDGSGMEETTDGSGMEETTDGGMEGTTEGGGASGDWRSIELTTVRGGEQFTVGGLEPPVVVHSFAVWCPKCKSQAEQLGKVTDSLRVVELNTDPNEDAAKVRDYAERNGFDWRFAVAPTEMTRALVDAFGTTVTSAPSSPLMFACGGGATAFEAGRVTPADEIESIANSC